MQGTSRFRPNSPPLIQETLQQETIMVNLETGAYYSLNTTGSHLWSCFEGGATVEEAGSSLTDAFEVTAASAEADIAAFVGELIADELIVERDGGEETGALPEQDGPKATYEAPKLAKYTDMQELLLLDPVHDVSAAGWPAQS